MATQLGRVQLYRNDDGTYQFRFVDEFNVIMFVGKLYSSKEEAVDVLETYFSTWTVEDGTGE